MHLLKILSDACLPLGLSTVPEWKEVTKIRRINDISREAGINLETAELISH
jgi:hypothetical protein